MSSYIKILLLYLDRICFFDPLTFVIIWQMVHFFYKFAHFNSPCFLRVINVPHGMFINYFILLRSSIFFKTGTYEKN